MSKLTFVPKRIDVANDYSIDGLNININFHITGWDMHNQNPDEIKAVLEHIRSGYPVTIVTQNFGEQEKVKSIKEDRKSDPQWATW